MTKLWITEPSAERSLVVDKTSYSPFTFATPFNRLLQHLSALLLDNNDKYLCVAPPLEERDYLEKLHHLGLVSSKKELPWVTHLDQNKYGGIGFWGLTPLIQNQVLESYPSQKLPPLDVVKKWTSKETILTKERIAFPLKSLESLLQWIKLNPEGVLKAPFGSAGSSLYFYNEHSSINKLSHWAKHILQGQGVILAEPWLKVDLCFSSLWWIHADESIEHLTNTVQLVSVDGRYLGTRIYKQIPDNYKAHLEKHLEKALVYAKQMQKMNYFGPVCFDAFTYREGHEVKLRAISEANMRYSMGSIAHKLSKMHPFDQYVELRYTKEETEHSLLPKAITGENGAPLKSPLSLVFKAV